MRQMRFVPLVRRRDLSAACVRDGWSWKCWSLLLPEKDTEPGIHVHTILYMSAVRGHALCPTRCFDRLGAKPIDCLPRWLPVLLHLFCQTTRRNPAGLIEERASPALADLPEVLVACRYRRPIWTNLQVSRVEITSEPNTAASAILALGEWKKANLEMRSVLQAAPLATQVISGAVLDFFFLSLFPLAFGKAPVHTMQMQLCTAWCAGFAAR